MRFSLLKVRFNAFLRPDARTFDTDAAFTMRSTVIGQEKSWGRVRLVGISRDLRSMPILNLKQNVEIFGYIWNSIP